MKKLTYFLSMVAALFLLQNCEVPDEVNNPVNKKPTVTISSNITPETELLMDSDIIVTADAKDSDGEIDSVRFEITTEKSVLDTTVISENPSSEEAFKLTFKPLDETAHLVMALAYDDQKEEVMTEEPVTFDVNNLPPKITISSEHHNGYVELGQEILITVEASDADGEVDRVELHLDGNQTPAFIATEQPFNLQFNFSADSEHIVDAVAFDKEGAETTSNQLMFYRNRAPESKILFPYENMLVKSGNTLRMQAKVWDEDENDGIRYVKAVVNGNEYNGTSIGNSFYIINIDTDGFGEGSQLINLVCEDARGGITENEILVKSYNDIIYEESFENYTDFEVDDVSPWIQKDFDNVRTYSIMNHKFENEQYTGSYIIFNPYECKTDTGGVSIPLSNNPRTLPIDGEKYLAAFSNTDETKPNNDWIVSEKIIVTPNSKLSFWARTYNDTYGLERFMVYATKQTDDLDFGDPGEEGQTDTNSMKVGEFEKLPISGSDSDGSVSHFVPTEWTKYVYDLSKFAGEDEIRVAITYRSNNTFFIMIDDLNVFNSPGAITNGEQGSMPDPGTELSKNKKVLDRK